MTAMNKLFTLILTMLCLSLPSFANQPGGTEGKEEAGGKVETGGKAEVGGKVGAGESSKSAGKKDHVKVLQSFYPQPTKDPNKAIRPAKAQLLRPKFLDTISTTTAVTLEWSSVGDTMKYHVQVATDPAFKWLVKDLFVDTTKLELGTLPGQAYYWRVFSFNPAEDPTFTTSTASSSSFKVQ